MKGLSNLNLIVYSNRSVTKTYSYWLSLFILILLCVFSVTYYLIEPKTALKTEMVSLEDKNQISRL